MKQIRVRIAPSPTGPFHVGTARTALFNYLFAKKYRGVFILRIEDTDIERSKPEFEKDIIEGLKWLGLKWDEGPIADAQTQKSKFKNQKYIGDYGPYRQSERREIYERYIKWLLDKGLAYYCFHGEEELEKERQAMLAMGEAPRYKGHCRALSPAEIKGKLKSGADYVIRFKMPRKKVVFRDLIRGQIAFDSSLFGDISIAKDVSLPLYNFAAVIDDYEMKISHVIRGEDHLSNTPKQILLQEALEFNRPQYAHLPLILGADRSKLSKRHGATAINEYRQMGYLPEAIINFLALIGWNPGTDREIFSLKELENEFSLERVGKSGAVFNIEKLNWLNSYYIRKKATKELSKLLKKDERIVKLFQDRLKTLNEIDDLAGFFFKERLEYNPELLIWKNDTKDKTLSILKELHNNIQKQEFKIALELLAEKFTTGSVFWPFRVALTGKKSSPDPLDIAKILGKEKVIQRIDEAIKKLQ